MITRGQCRIYAQDFRDLGMSREISIQRAVILRSISQSWTILADQFERLADVDTDEKPSRFN
jgi:hypothetical protein